MNKLIQFAILQLFSHNFTTQCCKIEKLGTRLRSSQLHCEVWNVIGNLGKKLALSFLLKYMFSRYQSSRVSFIQNFVGKLDNI